MPVVRFFAAAKAVTKVSQTQIPADTIEQALSIAIQNYPGLDQVLNKCSYLLNEIACHDLQTQVSDLDTIDVLPPFAGG